MRTSHCVGRLRRLVDARRAASRRVARGVAEGRRGEVFSYLLVKFFIRTALFSAYLRKLLCVYVLLLFFCNTFHSTQIHFIYLYQKEGLKIAKRYFYLLQG
jgi:hypothetical protein